MKEREMTDESIQGIKKNQREFAKDIVFLSHVLSGVVSSGGAKPQKHLALKRRLLRARDCGVL
jgi:hypothetical protein